MSESTGEIAEVLPFDGGGRPYSYRIPPTLTGKIRLGQLVRVPLGNTTRLGVVWDEGSGKDNGTTMPARRAPKPDAETPAHGTSLLPDLAPPTPLPHRGQAAGGTPQPRLKSILQLCEETPVLSPDLPALARWMASYYACPLNSVLDTIIPAAVRHGVRVVVEKRLSLARRPDTAELERLRRRAPKQAALCDFLATQNVPVERGATLRGLEIPPASLSALINAGIVLEEAGQLPRDAYTDALGEAEIVAGAPHALNPGQLAAMEDIRSDLASRRFRARLLHGVTGSGKTEVYIGAMREVLASGGSAAFLVPEVALTPQTVGRLRHRLADAGTRVVVWHSHLSAGERYDAWMAMVRGEARVVVGARSAVFAPLQNLRLIVVDEEHEPSYKQGATPLYNGRDVAIWRAMRNGALALPGSATPALETLANVRSGKYACSRLATRVDDRSLPAFRIVDMRRELLHMRGQTLLSPPLVDALRKRLEHGEQGILFLNRRGYSRQYICPACGHVAGCPHCSLALTHHRATNLLRCHACGHSQPTPSVCPECHSPAIRGRGAGTQKLEDALRSALPKARAVRLDADTMVRKNLFREVLADFRRGKIDFLLGTQMLAKGLDFPNVTLVGIVDADLSLHAPDFRAAERTFQLLVQVSGRAGRGEREGEVFVQTLTPGADPIQFAKRTDFDGFLDAELALRQAHGYPPERHLVRHLFRGRNPDKVAFYANDWAQFAEHHLPQGLVEMRGPAPCPLEKLQDNYRWSIWYFTSRVTAAVAHLQHLRSHFALPDEVTDLLDVDAMDLS
ncbi:MAG: primosomal protein N' [Puniceicoccales bacterium]|jgi:primosomal protein N' (replication factor Y)|nr:primosomal protein N' [Puniceicoccales bacterium]